jgi:hypothetical protein
MVQNTVKSRFKNLVVSGCSFTHEPINEWNPFSWANTFGHLTDMVVHNLAMPGAGNDHISKSIILYMERNSFDPADTLVLVMWSGVGRIDWIADRSKSNFGDEYPFTYNYDDNNELVLGGNWWNKKNPSPLIKTLINYSKYQSDSTFALHTWLAMQNLSNYLKVNNFEYYYTSFLNYNNTKIKGDALTVNFFKELENLNLSIDYNHWLDFQDEEYYGDWSRIHNFLDDDGFHPRYPKATEGWTKEILIPKLIKLGILYNV